MAKLTVAVTVLIVPTIKNDRLILFLHVCDKLKCSLQNPLVWLEVLYLNLNEIKLTLEKKNLHRRKQKSDFQNVWVYLG